MTSHKSKEQRLFTIIILHHITFELQNSVNMLPLNMIASSLLCPNTKTGYLFLLLFLVCAFSFRAQDTDSDLILDTNECELLIPSQSFEDAVPYDTPPQGWLASGYDFGFGWGTHDFPSGNANYDDAPHGNQFLKVNTQALFTPPDIHTPVTKTLTMNAQNAVYSESGYIFTFWAGEGASFHNFRNDGTTFVQMGYGTNAGDFTPIPDPDAALTINPLDTPQSLLSPPEGIWTQFSISFSIDAASPALGKGILIQISHTSGIDINNDPSNLINGYAGNYDDFHLLLDTDSDGIENCVDPDADGDGVPDGMEAGWATYDANVDGSQYDFDNDGVVDGNAYLSFPGSDDPTLIRDLDSDNDGIDDAMEGCQLGGGTGFDFESTVIVDDPLSPATNEMYSDGTITYWDVQTTGSGGNAIGVHYANVQNTIENNITGENYAPNYLTDGRGIYNGPNPQDNGKFAYINGTGTITQLPDPSRNAPIEMGSYILTVALGDGIDYEKLYRNDGQTTLELGYNDGGTFTPLSSRVIAGHETPNGLWTDFQLSVTIPDGSPAIGNLLLVRISHVGDFDNNQGVGNYDNIRIAFDFDGDGAPDCLDLDSDNDGCSDATEGGEGYSDDDNDGFLGVGVPTVDANGLVVGAGGYVLAENIAVRSDGTVSLSNTLTNANVCVAAEASFTIAASATNGGILQYEWRVSTDGGATFSAPLAETSNTLSFDTTAADNNNVYRVEVWSTNYLCRQRSAATLTLIDAPALTDISAEENSICVGSEAVFNITGNPNDTITFTIDGGTSTTTSILDGAGTSAIPVPDLTADVTLEVLSIVDAVTGCKANFVAPYPYTATVVADVVPTFTIEETPCAPDLQTYSVTYSAPYGTLTTDPSFTVNGTTISGIPTGTDFQVQVANNSCVRTFEVFSPDCPCPIIAPPVDPVDAQTCFGEAMPTLSVSLPLDGLGDDINWFDSAEYGALLAIGPDFTPTETGIGSYTYFAEAIQTVSECTSIERIPVTLTIIDPALPTEVTVTLSAINGNGNTTNQVTVNTSGTDTLDNILEYSLDDPFGPYQTSNMYRDVPGGLHTVYVRNTNGCGSVVNSEEFLVIRAAKFFTPNGDGIHDTWRVEGFSDTTTVSEPFIELYDRYGTFLKSLDPNGPGWDGIFNGRTLPENDYWYKAGYIDRNTGKAIQFTGHLTLKR